MIFSFLLGFCYLVQSCTRLDWPDPDAESFLGSFSSKTAYRNSILGINKRSTVTDDKCALVHITSLFRHGTRYSSKDDMLDITKVHEKILKSKVRRKLPKSFLHWKNPFSTEKAKMLSVVGYEEMINLGRRFRDRFDRMKGNVKGTKLIAAFSSSVSRARESGSTFLHKFFRGEKPFAEIDEMIKERDEQLRFFDHCPYYTKSVLKNKTSKVEYNEFDKGEEIKAAIRHVRERWNLMDISLTEKDVRSLYIMCGYEIANNISKGMLPYRCSLSLDKASMVCPHAEKFAPRQWSPLCSLLDRPHYVIFEYLYDLKHYWLKAYGREINWVQSCTLMSPMLEYVTKAAEGYGKAMRAASKSGKTLEYHLSELDYIRATFWFGHAETLLPVVALLGIFNQSTPMTARNYKERLRMISDPKEVFKTFRVSNISPLSGNLALELYHCPRLAKGSDDGFVVEVRSNEETVQWPLAAGGTQASLEAVKKHLQICDPNVFEHERVCVQGNLPKV